jgi:hypothetical protein
VKKPIPEMRTALRWNLLLGASFKRSLTVVAPARTVGGTVAASPAGLKDATARPVVSEFFTLSSVPLSPTVSLLSGGNPSTIFR